VADKKGTGSKSRTLFPAATNPIARVAVDIPLAHLDRPFDYKVPARLDGAARPGVRVRVRFAGQYLDGFILERTAASEHAGRLAYLDKVVSPEPVLTPEIAGLARAVADRYAGTLADVLRLAVPPRHAATESAPHGDPPPPRPGRPAPGSWLRYPAGPAFLDAVAEGRPARAAWTALPGGAPGTGGSPGTDGSPGIAAPGNDGRDPDGPGIVGWPDEIARAAATARAPGAAP
jgi:primosomal protein N' (replication factor Y)